MTTVTPAVTTDKPFITQSDFERSGFEWKYAEYFERFLNKDFKLVKEQTAPLKPAPAKVAKAMVERHTTFKQNDGSDATCAWSSIVHQQKMFYLRCWTHLQKHVKLETFKQKSRYKTVCTAIREEQAKCLEFLAQTVKSGTAWQTIAPDVHRLVTTRLRSDIEACIGADPHIGLHQTVNLTAATGKKNKPSIAFVETAQCKGEIPMLEISVGTEIGHSQELSTARKPRVSSTDVTALAWELRADAFAPAAAISTIAQLTGPEYLASWIVPIDVMELKRSGVGVPRKFVRMSEPLPRRSVCTRGAYKVYFNEALTANIRTEHSMPADAAHRPIPITTSNVFEPKSAAMKPLDVMNKRGKSMAAAGVSNLALISVDEMDVLKRELQGGGKSLSGNTEGNQLDVGDNLRTAENLIMNTFELGSTRLLVAASVDGHAQHATTGASELVSVESRIELQPTFGAERRSEAERAQIWWNCFLANTDAVKCVHIDPLTSSICHVGSLKREELLSEPPLKSIGLLQRILDSTSKLAAGSYLLEHSPGAVHVCIYRVTTSDTAAGATRLSGFYRDVLIGQRPVVDERATEWRDIDTDAVTQLHMNDGEVPATFPSVRQGRRPVRKQAAIVKTVEEVDTSKDADHEDDAALASHTNEKMLKRTNVTYEDIDDQETGTEVGEVDVATSSEKRNAPFVGLCESVKRRCRKSSTTGGDVKFEEF